MIHNQERWRNIDYGSVISVEHGWVKTFAIWPVKTINKEWMWLSTVYYRRVWVCTGFCDEPETQYGTLFDVLRS